MPGKIYVERIDLGGRALFTLNFDPNGILPGNAGDFALRTDAPNGAAYVNEDGALAWKDLGGGGGPGSGNTLSFPIGTSTADSATAIPAGALISSVRVEIDTAYPPGTQIEIGSPASPNLLATTSMTRPEEVELYEILPANGAPPIWSSSSVVRATLFGAPAFGSGQVTVSWIATPLP